MLITNSLFINQFFFFLLFTLNFFNGIEFFGIELYLYLSILICLFNIEKIFQLNLKILVLPILFILLIYSKQFLDTFLLFQIDKNVISYLIRSIFFLIFFILGIVFYREVILKSGKNFYNFFLFLLIFINLFFYINFIIEPSSLLIKNYEILKGLNENLYILSIFFLIGIIIKNNIFKIDFKIYFLFCMFLLLLFFVQARALLIINIIFIIGYFLLNNKNLKKINYINKFYSKKFILLSFLLFLLFHAYYLYTFHDDNMSDKIRYTLFITGYNEFIKNPYGIGIDQIKYINTIEVFKVLPELKKIWDVDYYVNSHNTFSQILSEFGLIGVILISSFFITTYKMIIEYKSYFLLTPVILYFNFSINIFFTITWFFLGILFAFIYEKK